MSINACGLITGVMFGFLMQKARIIRYDKQLAALRLQDMTIVKFMLSAVVVGIIGVYTLSDLSIIKLSIKPTILGAVIIGGFVFGIGWGLLGYCPGTAVGALGEGRQDAYWGILGMLFGAALFAELYPGIKETILTWGNYGKITLSSILYVNHWFIIPLLVFLIILLFCWFEQKKL